MLSHRFTSYVVPALSLLLLVQSAGAQQSGWPITPSTRQSLPSRYYYAVLGAVGVPGVYEYRSELPTLADVIHAAEGLTSAASGTFRVVREGKVSRQMFYSPASKMMLLSGDILILDKSFSGTQTGDRPSAALESQSLVRIVAVNLIDRPVVMSLPSEYATLERLVALLNQSPNVVPTVKILQAKTSEYIGPGMNLGKIRLLPESILIFDRSVVRIDQIPKLPPVYQPRVTTASHRQIRSSSSGESTGKISKGDIELAAGSSSQSERYGIDHPEKMFWASSPLENAPEPKAKPAYEDPPNWTYLNREEPSTKPQADDLKIAPDRPPTLPPADSLAFLPNEKEVSESAEKSTVAAETSKITNPLKTLARQGLIVLGFVGLLGAGWFFRKKLQQRVKSQFTFQPVKKKTGGILDALIENKLTLVEESFTFPEGLDLQVPAASTTRTVPTLQAAAPVSQKKFRVDTNRTIQRLHFPSEDIQLKPFLSSSVTKTAQIDAIPETPPVVSGLSEPVEMIPQARDVPQPAALLQSIEQNSETEQTRIPETKAITSYVYSTTWLDSSCVSERAGDSPSDSRRGTEPSRDKSSASTSSDQINRIDSPQTTFPRPHARSSGWVLDRVLVALHGVTRQ